MTDETPVHALKIDLAAPVAASDPYIHLDSFVAYAAGVESIGVDGLDALEDGGEPRYFEAEMPFEQYRVKTDANGGAEWVWAASSAGIAHPEDGGQTGTPERWNTTRWRKRFDVDPVHQIKRTQIATSTGEFKAYDAALPYAAADSLTFFFEPGAGIDPGRVVELIDEHVPAIGKKRSQGFGAIRDVSLTDATGAVESAIYHNGRVLRSIPASFFARVQDGLTYERRSVRPPYWHAANHALAVEPFADVNRSVLAPELGFGTPEVDA